ncbi:hypothetical protein ACHAPM_005801 [Fusarium culmorum]
MSNTNSSSDRAQTNDDKVPPSEALAGEMSALTLESRENGEVLNAESPTDTSESMIQLSLALDALVHTVKQIQTHVLADAQDPAPSRDPGSA